MSGLEQIKQAVTYSNQYFIFNFLKVYFGPIWFAKVENVFLSLIKIFLSVAGAPYFSQLGPIWCATHFKIFFVVFWCAIFLVGGCSGALYYIYIWLPWGPSVHLHYTCEYSHRCPIKVGVLFVILQFFIGPKNINIWDEHGR